MRFLHLWGFIYNFHGWDDFQFSLWDSHSPLRRALKVLRDFQFSLWDSRTNPEIARKAARDTFNSLYEIRLGLDEERRKLQLSFQFSLWDSNTYWWGESINSKNSFNSLYEIPSITTASRNIIRKSFQFSLWDSRLMGFYGRFSLSLSILSMRFRESRFEPFRIAENTFNSLYEIRKRKKWGCWGLLVFQFSLWDSAISWETLEIVFYPNYVFQFSLWDSLTVALKGFGVTVYFQFSLWDSNVIWVWKTTHRDTMLSILSMRFRGFFLFYFSFCFGFAFKFYVFLRLCGICI